MSKYAYIEPSAYKSKPLKTGQTTQYSGMADDGDLEIGKARSYTALTTGQYSGTTNITVNAKTIAMENGAVIDNQTGLMWMAYTPDSDIGPDSNGKLLWYDATNREDIFNFCDQANAASLSGYTDWRVPNIFELYSLIVFATGIGAPYINTTYFQCVSAYYWTSTTDVLTVANAVILGFQNIASGDGGPKATTKQYVRLVRGGAN